MKKFLKFVLIGMSVLFLVSCGKPDSQKAFESSFKLLATELEKQVPNDDPVTKSFDDLFKRSDLSYVEKNLIVKMQKEDGEWKIVNFSEVLGAALGGLDKLFENEEAENNSN